MPPTPKISDIETAFSGLHDRIHMLEEVQERMRANLSDESAIIRDEMRHCISETSANILSSHCDATAQIVSIIEDRDAAWDRSLSIMRRHLENIEETQSRTQKFYKELRNQQLALDTVELLLMNNDNLANSVKELHSELAALASTPPKTTLLDMVQTAGDVTNVAITVGIFIAVAMQTIDRVRKRADHQEPTHGYSHGISDMIQFDYFYNLPSYPFELAWKSREQDQGIRWDPAARAWGVVVPDQILMMLDVTFGQKPASGITKNYFLPEEGIHADVLGADASLYLGQRVWLGFKSNMVCCCPVSHGLLIALTRHRELMDI